MSAAKAQKRTTKVRYRGSQHFLHGEYDLVRECCCQDVNQHGVALPNVVLYNPETDVRLSHVRPESWVPVETSDAHGVGTVECDLCDWTHDTRDWADALSAKADHYHHAHDQRVPIPLAS